jgi:hypothetical protein
MNHLTDGELIDYTLKYDTDPVRVRLAKIMDNMPGFILKRLEDVGMDPETCMFENNYDPGDWIRHLENELEYLNNELYKTQEELVRRQTLTVADFIEELRQENRRLENRISVSDTARRSAEKEKEQMHSKLKMWSALNGSLHVKI